MGSMAEHSGRVGVVFSVKNKTPNTPENVERFLHSNRLTVEQTTTPSKQDIEQLYIDNTEFTLEFKDYELVTSGGNTKEEVVAFIANYDDPSGYILTKQAPLAAEGLRDVDLDLVVRLRILTVQSDLKATVWITEVSGSIYYDNDNLESVSKKLEPIHKNILNLPNAELILEINGS